MPTRDIASHYARKAVGKGVFTMYADTGITGKAGAAVARKGCIGIDQAIATMIQRART